MKKDHGSFYCVFITVITMLILGCATFSGSGSAKIETYSSHHPKLDSSNTFIVRTMEYNFGGTNTNQNDSRTPPPLPIPKDMYNLLEQEALYYLESYLKNNGWEKTGNNTELIFDIGILIGANDYGYYFPKVEIYASIWDPNKQQLVTVWGGYAYRRVQSSQGREFYPSLIEELMSRFPN